MIVDVFFGGFFVVGYFFDFFLYGYYKVCVEEREEWYEGKSFGEVEVVG